MAPFGEGQWALGYREPLNKSERIKRDDDGLNVRDRILNVYSKEGFSSIWPDDLRGRMRWWGLYTQRRQGIPGGMTARCEPHELEDEFFMMRIRIAGGQMNSDQLRTIAQISERYGRGVADVTDRQNIQLHWIRIEDVPTIWEMLDEVALTTCEACGDCPRNMLGCPVAGADAEELFDATPDLMRVSERFLGDPDFSNLPRKFKTSITACSQHCAQHETQDIAFVGVEHEGKLGYDMWIGGGLGPNPHFGQRLGVFIERDQIVDAWAAGAGVFRDYGFRRARNRARVKFLMKAWGAEKYRKVMQDEYLGYQLPDGPEPSPSTSAQRDHVGVYDQADGNKYVGLAPKAGRTSSVQLRRVADLADQYAQGRIRATTQQKLVILDVKPDGAADLVDALERMDMPVNPSQFRRATMACTGIEFCKLAIVETKQRADWLYRELEDRLPDFDEALRININGCPNSCARFQIADIGFMGSMMSKPDGTKYDGFQVQLGGHLGENYKFGRKVKGLKVPAHQLADYTEKLLKTYLSTKADEEQFYQWAERAPDAWLK